ncbi:MAG: hypothetical protein K0S07_21 [Chlamydiales bacterium]|nr:hypothetical protein [Chlamydiales bacterium]
MYNYTMQNGSSYSVPNSGMGSAPRPIQQPAPSPAPRLNPIFEPGMLPFPAFSTQPATGQSQPAPRQYYVNLDRLPELIDAAVKNILQQILIPIPQTEVQLTPLARNAAVETTTTTTTTTTMTATADSSRGSAVNKRPIEEATSIQNPRLLKRRIKEEMTSEKEYSLEQRIIVEEETDPEDEISPIEIQPMVRRRKSKLLSEHRAQVIIELFMKHRDALINAIQKEENRLLGSGPNPVRYVVNIYENFLHATSVDVGQSIFSKVLCVICERELGDDRLVPSGLLQYRQLSPTIARYLDRNIGK